MKPPLRLKVDSSHPLLRGPNPNRLFHFLFLKKPSTSKSGWLLGDRRTRLLSRPPAQPRNSNSSSTHCSCRTRSLLWGRCSPLKRLFYLKIRNMKQQLLFLISTAMRPESCRASHLRRPQPLTEVEPFELKRKTKVNKPLPKPILRNQMKKPRRRSHSGSGSFPFSNPTTDTPPLSRWKARALLICTN